MNILVTGANGQLGNEIRRKSARSKDKYLFTDVQELDICNREAVFSFVETEHIEVIVNCAAYTNVEKAEDEEEFAEMLNATAVSYLAQAAKKNDAVLIHISTDYVFGGQAYNTPCSEKDAKGNPTGIYGKTKLHGEKAIAESGCRSIILRTAWLYSKFGKNFVKTMLYLTSSKPEIKVVFDQVGTPTYAGDLATFIVGIIDNRMLDRCGTYHFSNEGAISWYDFAKAIAELGGTSGKILPCHSDEFPSKVLRPYYSVLDKTLLKESFGVEIPYWKDSLKECIDEIKEDN